MQNNANKIILVWPVVIPAAAIGAPHRRDRVWIIAHAQSPRDRGEPSNVSQKERRPQRHQIRQSRGSDKVSTSPANSQRVRRGERSSQGDNEYTKLQRSGKEGEGQCGLGSGVGSNQRTTWKENWPEVAARLCIVDDGLSGGLARPKRWRNAALKGAGNAIVPQVAIQIMQAIRAVDPSL